MRLVLLLVGSVIVASAMAQQPPVSKDFISYQKGFKRVNDAFRIKEDTLKKQFEAQGINWPAKFMYIRSFKYDSKMEIWLKSERNAPYKLFKTYKVCAMAGTLGPKRMEGDYQVPEGFYYINEFKPNSNYHLALGVSYPNSSDRILSDTMHPGAEIFVHGSCVTVGCIPITNDQIEEVYLLAASVHNQGQDFIPIHVFPIAFRNHKSGEYLQKFVDLHPEYTPMLDKMKYAYYYFEQKKTLPVVMVDKKGLYSFADEVKLTYDDDRPIPKKELPKIYATKVNFDETSISKNIYRQAIAPNGMKGFQQFLESLQTDLTDFLPEGNKRIFANVEFIIDKTGKLILPKLLNNVPPEIHNRIIEKLEAMPAWQPAIDTNEKPVAVKLQQGIEINAKS